MKFAHDGGSFYDDDVLPSLFPSLDKPWCVLAGVWVFSFNASQGLRATHCHRKKKYSNKLSMKALVEKDILMKNKEKR